MRNYSFMQNLPENYSIIQYEKQTRTARKNKSRNGSLCKSKKLYPRLSKAEIQFPFFNDFYIVYQPLYAIVALQPLNHSLPNNLAA